MCIGSTVLGSEVNVVGRAISQKALWAMVRTLGYVLVIEPLEFFKKERDIIIIYFINAHSKGVLWRTV